MSRPPRSHDLGQNGKGPGSAWNAKPPDVVSMKNGTLRYKKLSRRGFVQGAGLGAGLATTGGMAHSAVPPSGNPAETEQRIPLRIGHRAASMKMVGNFDIFKFARRIPGLMGVELQVASGTPNLRDWDAVRRYKMEANRCGIMIPSLSGIWDRGVSIIRSPVAGVNLTQAIRVAEFLGSSVILVAFFRDNAPDMNDESSFGPVVELLHAAAPLAAEAGVVMGLENSLSPAGNKKLIDLVAHPNVKVYYDLHNMAHYGHGDQAIPGVKLLGKERICQVHVKNGDKLLAEPGPIDWGAAFEALNAIAYDGWYVFESRHSGPQNVIEATAKNIEFLGKHCRMPAG